MTTYCVEASVRRGDWFEVVDFDADLDSIADASLIAENVIRENPIISRTRVVAARSDDEDEFPTVCEFVRSFDKIIKI